MCCPVRRYLGLSFLLLCYSIFNITCYGETAAFGNSECLQTVWTTEDGLPQNSVNAILQSRDGYLWLATFGGLARFDGVRFTIFNSGNTPGLLSNRIYRCAKTVTEQFGWRRRATKR